VARESLDEFLRRGRAQVDAALDRYLPRPPSCPAIVSEAMRYSVFAGGKRFRPMLTLAAADAVEQRGGARRLRAEGASASLAVARKDRERAEAGGFSRAFDLALPSACAIELIHTYSLIHDDLPAMDDDTLRRGRPTLHVLYGDGVAILAGDGLHAEAFALLAREPATDDPVAIARKLRIVQIVGEAAGPSGMVGGQAIDLQAAGQVPGHPVTLDPDGLRAMHARKTGALIRASAASGAVMAGASDAQVAAVDRYATEVGLAFQIVDDILDVEGTADQLGKTAGKDAAGEKPSYPALFGIDRSRALAAECLERARQALADAKLTDGQLGAIAEWVVTRKS
jgi:geranylgeranyl diphosphate synthase, type II